MWQCICKVQSRDVSFIPCSQQQHVSSWPASTPFSLVRYHRERSVLMDPLRTRYTALSAKLQRNGYEADNPVWLPASYSCMIGGNEHYPTDTRNFQVTLSKNFALEKLVGRKEIFFSIENVNLGVRLCACVPYVVLRDTASKWNLSGSEKSSSKKQATLLHPQHKMPTPAPKMTNIIEKYLISSTRSSTKSWLEKK